VRKFGFTFAVVAALAGSAVGQETIDNPEFASWSKFKSGTSVTLKNTTTTKDATLETVIITKLIEAGSDKLVLELTVISNINGMEFKQPPTKRDVAKTITLPKGTPKPDPTKKLDATIEEGMETVKVAGGEFKAKWYKSKFEAGGSKIETKAWTSEDVPGGLVKSETTTTGVNAATIKMEVTELKKP